MEKGLILDSDFLGTKQDQIYKTIRWWESKRFIFNLIVITTQCVMMWNFWTGTKLFGLSEALIWSIIYLIVGNIFYSVGWAQTIVIDYYNLKFLNWVKKINILLFLFGICFSILVTYLMYGETLYVLEMERF